MHYKDYLMKIFVYSKTIKIILSRVQTSIRYLYEILDINLCLKNCEIIA